MSKRTHFLILLFGTLVSMIAGAVTLASVGMRQSADMLVGAGLFLFVIMACTVLYTLFED